MIVAYCICLYRTDIFLLYMRDLWIRHKIKNKENGKPISSLPLVLSLPFFCSDRPQGRYA
jgi:hypothetical protein